MKNLAHDATFAAEKARLAQWMPQNNSPALPGSKSRFVELRDGKVYWEGVEVMSAAPAH